VVLLTAAAQAQDRQRGLAAGADHYLTKPFSPLALLTLVRSLMPEVSIWPAV
jgi:DNA-binding response OmpR family regulator